MKPDKGMIQIYTGDGKGKTTAAIGQAVRAMGRGLSVYMIQFMKGNTEYGELKLLERLSEMKIKQFGRPDFVKPREPEPVDIEMAESALSHAEEILKSGDYDIVILDEACIAAGWGLIRPGELEKILKERAPHVEVILTGRACPPEIMKLGDLVTEMKEIRHYYKKGIPARQGIEY